MAMLWSHKGVRDFVQDRVSDLGLGVQQRELLAESDRVSPVYTDTEPPHGAVKPKMPMGETVLGHQPQGEIFGVVQDHWQIVCQRYNNYRYFFNERSGDR